eukprot:287574_1
MHLKWQLFLFNIFLINTNGQYTPITGTWQDDYLLQTYKWTDDHGVIKETASHKYHGAFEGDIDPERDIRWIMREFYCNQYNSSVEVTFSIYYCGTDNNDNVELFLNGVSMGQTIANGGSSWNDNEICSGNADYKTVAPSTIDLVPVGNTFTVQLYANVNFLGDTIYINNIVITCHPITVVPTVQTVIPTSNPTIVPTLHPTMIPTHIPSIYVQPTNIPTLDPTLMPTATENEGQQQDQTIGITKTTQDIKGDFRVNISNNGMIIGIVFGIVGGFIVIILVIYIMHIYRRKSSNDAEKGIHTGMELGENIHTKRANDIGHAVHSNSNIIAQDVEIDDDKFIVNDVNKLHETMGNTVHVNSDEEIIDENLLMTSNGLSDDEFVVNDENIIVETETETRAQ